MYQSGRPDERSKQVSIMGRLYSQAQSVHAWLGEEDPFMRGALTALATIANLNDDAVASARLINPVLGDLQPYNLSAKNPSFAIYAFFKRTWFLRAWILQEAVLTNHLVFMCGSLIGPWSMLYFSATFLFASKWLGAIASGAKKYIETGVTHDEFELLLQRQLLELGRRS